MSEKKKFTKKSKRMDIDIDGEEYSIREFFGTERDNWMSGMTKRAKLDAAGKPIGATNVVGIQSSLITLCLFDSDGERVPAATVDSWPASTVQDLFKECQTINGLDEASKETEKKD
jgi:hypothetical protein